MLFLSTMATGGSRYVNVPVTLEGSVDRAAGTNELISVRVTLPFTDRGENGFWASVTALVDEHGTPYKRSEIEELLKALTEPKPNADEVGRARSFFRDNDLPKGDKEQYVHHLSRIFAHIRHSSEKRGQGVGRFLMNDTDMSNILNWEVARNYIGNAASYAKSGDMATVLNNLELIASLLEHPNEINTEHSWDDFK